MAMTSANAQPWMYLDVVHAVEQIGDEQAMRAMLPMLQDLLERDVPQIRQLLAEGDVRSANGLLHSLKGCMPIFCAATLCSELSQVELLSKSAGSAEVVVAFAPLGPQLDSLRNEIVQYLALPA